MMSSSKTFLIVLILIVVLGFAGSFLVDKDPHNSGPGEMEVLEPLPADDGFPKAKAQTSTDRKWKTLGLKKAFSVGGEQDTILYRPSSLIIDSKENIYVLDYGDLKIAKFSPDGHFLVKYGKGRGSGPGELQNPTDFFVDDIGNIWVTDPVLGIITVFDGKGEVEKTFRLKSLALRIRILGEENIVSKPSSGGEHLLEKYDAKGNLELSFGKLFPDQTRTPIMMDGLLEVIDKKSVLFAFIRAGFIVSFASNGEILFFVETIEKIGLPKVNVFQRGDTRVTKVDPNAPVSALCVNVFNSNIYLLSGAGSLEQEGMVVDTYDAKTGDYLFSIKTPEKFRSCYVTDKYMLTIKDTELTRFDLAY